MKNTEHTASSSNEEVAKTMKLDACHCTGHSFTIGMFHVYKLLNSRKIF